MFILKRLRQKKNISQSKLAKEIGVSLRTIQLYERQDANIPLKNLKKIAEYFELGVRDLYLNERVGEPSGNYESQGSLGNRENSIKKVAPGKYLIKAPLVISSVQEDYIGYFDDLVFLQKLPSMDMFVEQVSVARYVAFEMANSSMDDGSKDSIPNKAILLGKLIAVNRVWGIWKEKPQTLWVVVHKGGIMCKKIVSYNKKENRIVCSSLSRSPEYSDFGIGLDDVLQIFMVIKKQVD